MDMPNDQAKHVAAIGPEAPEQAVARIVRERKIIREAKADIAAGNGIECIAVETWLNELDENPNAQPPEPQRPPARD